MTDVPEKPKRRLTKKQRALIKPSTGLPAMGAGWGGPAKGAGMGPEGLKWGEEKKDAADPAKRQTKEVLAQEAMDALVEIMRTAESPGLKLHAATAVLNRVEGLPVARQVTATAESLEDMVMKAAAIRSLPETKS